MGDAFYHIVVLAVAVLAVAKGFRRGFTGQISGILGLAFGAVCAHVFDDQAEAVVRMLLPGIQGRPGAAFIYSVVSAGLVYVAVYLAFKLLTGVLRSAMQVFCVGMLDKLLGAAFCLVKYMLFLSLAYNLVVCVNPRSPLMKYANDSDGNVVQLVMSLAPELLGCRSFEDLFHLMQLRDARRISRNHKVCPDVINDVYHRDYSKIKIENA